VVTFLFMDHRATSESGPESTVGELNSLLDSGKDPRWDALEWLEENYFRRRQRHDPDVGDVGLYDLAER
jgi:hypothetical protein